MLTGIEKSHNRSLLLTLISLAAGGILPFAFAPFSYYPIAFISMSLLLLAWLQAKPILAFLRGFLFGLGMFGIGTSWIYISIHRFGNTNIPLAVLITSLFILLLALFPACCGYLFARYFSRPSLINLLLAFPCLWVLFEWLREWVFTGFPWLFLGYVQTDTTLRGFAPLIGIYGLSFLTVLSSALIVAIAIRKNRIRYLSFIGLISIWLTGCLLTTIHWTHPLNKPISISIIQGNIPQQVKWQPNQIQTILERYKTLTKNHWNSQLILWPEGAITLPLPYSLHYFNQMNQIALSHHANLITGVPIENDQSRFYNAAIGLGLAKGHYYKRHLVPFGEYLPFEQWLRGLINFFDIPMSDFISGPRVQKLMTINHVPVGIYICYEIAYPSLVQTELPRAKLLITLSNDAWFGDSFAAAQHLQMGQMRSLEAGRYGLFATNNGLTAIINDQGKVIKTVPRFKSTALEGKIYFMDGSTPLTAIGSNMIVIFILLLLLMNFFFLKIEKN